MTTLKIIALAALSLAVFAPAEAANILPKEFHGHWCVDAATYDTSDASTIIYHRKVGKSHARSRTATTTTRCGSAPRVSTGVASTAGGLLKCRDSIDGRTRRSEMKLHKGRLFKTDLDL